MKSVGTIDVSSLKKLLKTHFHGRIDDLRKALPSMIPDQDIIKQRIEQIAISVQLDQYSAGADAMLKMKAMFKLTGDFSDIEALSQAVSFQRS